MSKSVLELEKLPNKDWLKLSIDKNKKKDLQQRLAPFVPAAKPT